MSEERTILAFMIAPLVVPFVFVSEALLFPDGTASGLPNWRMTLGGLLLYSIHGLPIAYLAEAVFGIAVWRAFRRYRVRSPIAFAVCGALIGSLVSIAIFRQYVWVCVVAGASSAVVFRYVVFAGEGQGGRLPKTQS